MCMFISIYLHIYYICVNSYCIKFRENISRDVSAISVFKRNSGTFVHGVFFLKHYISVV